MRPTSCLNNIDGIVKNQNPTSLSNAKTACYEVRKVVLVAFVENDMSQ